MSATLGTRATLRRVEAGIREKCSYCGDYTRFRAKGRLTNNYVIANCYVDGRWDRVEFFHANCYETGAGEPYGPARA